jgi:osmotically inducible protein OsmC
MMAERHAEATWNGSLRDGNGTMKFGTFEGSYSFSSRFENGQGTNPEELLGAAHAGCYSMALSSSLGKAGFAPESIYTTATVKLETVSGKAMITHIHLDTKAKVSGITEEKFIQVANEVKSACPVSIALSNVPITLSAELLQ